MMDDTRITSRWRRGSVIMIVLWTLAIAAIVTSAIQLSAQRQASLGREVLERAQARWAARGGVEYTIAVMTDHTLRPVPDDAFAMVRDMEAVAFGDVIGASYDIRHHADGRDWFGPLDEHSRLNINRANMGHLMLLDDMWLDIADAILEWTDEEHEAEGMGVGRNYYLSLTPPYLPRNGPYQNIHEMELVAGVWPKYLRGEDWNMNNRLDSNENDGGALFPPDNSDGRLEAGWSAYLTAHSIDAGATSSGLPRIYLPRAKIAEVIERLGVEELQAKALIRYGRNTSNTSLTPLLFQPITNIDAQGALSQAPYNPDLPPLTDEQIQMAMDEFSMQRHYERDAGRMNLNTVDPQYLRDLLELYGADPFVADEILFLRDSRPEGITSLLELREIPEISDDLLEQMTQMFTTRSNVYTISSRGRSWSTGTEVEIIAVVDRSTVPVQILEYREQ